MALLDEVAVQYAAAIIAILINALDGGPDFATGAAGAAPPGRGGALFFEKQPHAK
jgi:hypothetical protein